MIFRFEIFPYDLCGSNPQGHESRKTVLSQLMSFLPKYEFNKCVDSYNVDYRVKSFTCQEQFYVMSFAQLTFRESLRVIEACLIALSDKLYHSGIKQPVSRSTLADANFY